jgi:hypothetical protein
MLILAAIGVFGLALVASARLGAHPRLYKFLTTSSHILYFKAPLLEAVGS